ncbi:hypothetical protein [Streptomyces sp. NPDC059142]
MADQLWGGNIRFTVYDLTGDEPAGACAPPRPGSPSTTPST